LSHVAVTYTSREEIEVYKFSALVSIGVPLVAVLLQAIVPLRFRFLLIFDLPVLVTIYFGVARRSQVAGLLTGAAIGLLQDTLTHQPIGLFGIAKTVIGYLAASIGVRVDVENPGSRLLMTAGFYLVHQFTYFLLARNVLGQALEWLWARNLVAAVANGLLAIALFALLNRFKQHA
jgi:rod shape-determining protein MreD